MSTNVKIKFDTVELREERRHKIRKRKEAGSYENANDFAEIVDQVPVNV